MYKKLLLSAVLMLHCATITPMAKLLWESCKPTLLLGVLGSAGMIAKERSIDTDTLLPLAKIVALSTIVSGSAGLLSRISGSTMATWYCTEHCPRSTQKACGTHNVNNQRYEVARFLMNHSTKIATLFGLLPLATLGYHKYCA